MEYSDQTANQNQEERFQTAIPTPTLLENHETIRVTQRNSANHFSKTMEYRKKSHQSNPRIKMAKYYNHT